MKDSVFIDSNLIIYLYSEDEPDKREICRNLTQTHTCLISTQVVNEVMSVLHRKMHTEVSELRKVVEELFSSFIVRAIEQQTITSALAILEKYGYAYWDSLIMASAMENECNTLYSEDMQHKQIIEGRLTITNPFIKNGKANMS